MLPLATIPALVIALLEKERIRARWYPEGYFEISVSRCPGLVYGTMHGDWSGHAADEALTIVPELVTLPLTASAEQIAAVILAAWDGVQTREGERDNATLRLMARSDYDDTSSVSCRCRESYSWSGFDEKLRPWLRQHEACYKIAPIEVFDHITPPTFPADAISADSPPVKHAMLRIRTLAEVMGSAKIQLRRRAPRPVPAPAPPPSRTPLLDELNLPPELLNQLLRTASPDVLEHMIRQYHQPLQGASLKAALDYLNSLQETNVTNTERTTKTISRNGAACDKAPLSNDTDENVAAQLEGIRLALCEIALNTAAIADLGEVAMRRWEESGK